MTEGALLQDILQKYQHWDLEEALVQISYAIGVAEPVAMYVNTYGTSRVDFDGEISEMLLSVFDLRPYSIEKLFDLRKPMYLRLLHMVIWAENQKVKKLLLILRINL